MLQSLDVNSIFHQIDNFEPHNMPLRTLPKTSTEETPKLELKALPPYLKYDFLNEDDKFSIILL